MRKCLICEKDKELTEYFEKNGKHSRVCKACTDKRGVPDRYLKQQKWTLLLRLKRFIKRLLTKKGRT